MQKDVAHERAPEKQPSDNAPRIVIVCSSNSCHGSDCHGTEQHVKKLLVMRIACNETIQEA